MLHDNSRQRYLTITTKDNVFIQHGKLYSANLSYLPCNVHSYCMLYESSVTYNNNDDDDDDDDDDNTK